MELYFLLEWQFHVSLEKDFLQFSLFFRKRKGRPSLVRCGPEIIYMLLKGSGKFKEFHFRFIFFFFFFWRRIFLILDTPYISLTRLYHEKVFQWTCYYLIPDTIRLRIWELRLLFSCLKIDKTFRFLFYRVQWNYNAINVPFALMSIQK